MAAQKQVHTWYFLDKSILVFQNLLLAQSRWSVRFFANQLSHVIYKDEIRCLCNLDYQDLTLA